MQDIIPISVIDIIRGHYALGVANAEAFYEQSSADEDSVTGALGQALARAEPIRFQKGFEEYQISISYKKVRGRGRGAPERLYGIDGIFQISVTSKDGGNALIKGLPFQSKKGWSGKDKNLLSQVDRMESEAPGGIVIDFGPDGYKACSAKDVIAAQGSRTIANRHNSVRSLEQILAHDFLNCHIGRRGMFYDASNERLSSWPLNQDSPVHMITTEVKVSHWG